MSRHFATLKTELKRRTESRLCRDEATSLRSLTRIPPRLAKPARRGHPNRFQRPYNYAVFCILAIA